MLESEHDAEVGVRQDAVHVARLDLVAFFSIGGLPVVAPGVVADAPQRTRRRREGERVVEPAAVLREDRVAGDAEGVEPRHGDVGEDRDVGRRADGVGPVDAVEPRGEQADAQARVLRVARSAGEGEVDLLLEGPVDGRAAEIVHDPLQKGLPAGRLRGERGIGIVQRVASRDIGVHAVALRILRPHAGRQGAEPAQAEAGNDDRTDHADLHPVICTGR